MVTPPATGRRRPGQRPGRRRRRRRWSSGPSRQAETAERLGLVQAHGQQDMARLHRAAGAGRARRRAHARLVEKNEQGLAFDPLEAEVGRPGNLVAPRPGLARAGHRRQQSVDEAVAPTADRGHDHLPVAIGRPGRRGHPDDAGHVVGARTALRSSGPRRGGPAGGPYRPARPGPPTPCGPHELVGADADQIRRADGRGAEVEPDEATWTASVWTRACRDRRRSGGGHAWSKRLSGPGLSLLTSITETNATSCPRRSRAVSAPISTTPAASTRRQSDPRHRSPPPTATRLRARSPSMA